MPMKRLLSQSARALNAHCGAVRRKWRLLADLAGEERRIFQVAVNVRLLNQSLLRAKGLAISAIDPVFDTARPGPARALRIIVEGPPSNIRYFERLLRKTRLCVG